MKILAPSRCTERPALLAASTVALNSFGETATPPALLWVFSTQRSRAGAKWTLLGRHQERTLSGGIIPSGS